MVFPPGVTEVPVTVGITPDNKCECDEKFTSQLRPPTSGNVSIGVNDTASITIVDDDGEYACMFMIEVVHHLLYILLCSYHIYTNYMKEEKTVRICTLLCNVHKSIMYNNIIMLI